MKKLLLTNSQDAFELLGEYAGLYGDNGGVPDGNTWLPSDQDDIPAEVAQKVVDARHGQMVNVLMSTDEGMISHFHLPVILENLDKDGQEEVFETLQELADGRTTARMVLVIAIGYSWRQNSSARNTLQFLYHLL